MRRRLRQLSGNEWPHGVVWEVFFSAGGQRREGLKVSVSREG